MAHREDIRAYLESLELKDCHVVDWGSGAKPVQRYLKTENCTFFLIDQRKNSDYPPDLVTDIQDELTLLKLADHAFCMEVLEHVLSPYEVLENIQRNLKPGGCLHLSVPFMYPVHSEDDYLRYTEHGLRAITEGSRLKVDFIKPTSQGYLMRAHR